MGQVLIWSIKIWSFLTKNGLKNESIFDSEMSQKWIILEGPFWQGLASPSAKSKDLASDWGLSPRGIELGFGPDKVWMEEADLPALGPPPRQALVGPAVD